MICLSDHWSKCKKSFYQRPDVIYGFRRKYLKRKYVVWSNLWTESICSRINMFLINFLFYKKLHAFLSIFKKHNFSLVWGFSLFLIVWLINYMFYYFDLQTFLSHLHVYIHSMFYNPNNYGNYWRDIKLTKIGDLWTICKCRYPIKQKLIGQSATEEITLIAKYSTC